MMHFHLNFGVLLCWFSWQEVQGCLQKLLSVYVHGVGCKARKGWIWGVTGNPLGMGVRDRNE